MTLKLLVICLCSFLVMACQDRTELPPIKIEPKSEPVPQKVYTEQERRSLHQNLLTLDSHIDIPATLGIGDADPSIKSPMQVDVPSMREGGLDAGFFIVYVKQGLFDAPAYQWAYRAALNKFAAIERMLSQSEQDLALVKSSTELKNGVLDGKLAVAVGMENAYPLGPNFEHIDEFYERGVRYISLTHFGNNQFADSSVPRAEMNGQPIPIHNGVSDLGFRLIDRMNDLGIMVDVSHASVESTMAAAAYSKTPVIASHSSVKSLNRHPRNLTDMEIKAIATSGQGSEGFTGGVIQLVAFDAYLRQMPKEEVDEAKEIKKRLGLDTENWYETATQTQIDQLRRARAALNATYPRTTVSQYVDHIVYVIDLVGIDHVGIASDFGGGGGVYGWDYVAQTQVITDELLARGFSEEDLQKIWGENLLRVWGEVERYAASQR